MRVTGRLGSAQRHYHIQRIPLFLNPFNDNAKKVFVVVQLVTFV